MKLIINISEDDYVWINNHIAQEITDYRTTSRLYKAIVNSIPLEQEPKTGHWTHDGSHWKNRFICSECNYKLFDEPTNYCPNCGAKME